MANRNVATTLLIGLCLMSAWCNASEPLVGRWRASEHDGEGGSMLIDLYLENGRLNGKVASVFDSKGAATNPKCEKCGGELGNGGIVGKTFVYGLERQDKKWVKGKVVNLRTGALQGIVVNCEIELVGKMAKIRGYLYFRAFSGEDYWERVVMEGEQ